MSHREERSFNVELSLVAEFDESYEGDEDGDLHPALKHLELLSTQQRIDEVDTDQRRDDQAEEVGTGERGERQSAHIRSIRSIAQ